MENEIILKLFLGIGTAVMTLSVLGVILIVIKHRRQTPIINKTKRGTLLSGTSSGKVNQIKFTEKELEIIKLSAQGLKAKKIADILYISTRTLNVHKQNIQKKYNFDSMMSAVLYCIHQKIIDLGEK